MEAGTCIGILREDKIGTHGVISSDAFRLCNRGGNNVRQRLLAVVLTAGMVIGSCGVAALSEKYFGNDMTQGDNRPGES